jgi:hypothetical protein
MLVANPVQFDVTRPGQRPGPRLRRAVTDEILLELGLDWDQHHRAQTAGAVT